MDTRSLSTGIKASDLRSLVPIRSGIDYRRERKNLSYQRRKEIPEFGGYSLAYRWTIRVV